VRPRLGRRRAHQLAFTLVELMVVVAIVGILATVGIALLRKHVFGSKTAEAVAGIQAIRAAQETYRAEAQTYFDVSTSLTAWYPMAAPGKERYHWVQLGGNDYANWQRLHPSITS